MDEAVGGNGAAIARSKSHEPGDDRGEATEAERKRARRRENAQRCRRRKKAPKSKVKAKQDAERMRQS